MPYMYDMPVGHEVFSQRARGADVEYSGSDVELLKLLNGGYQRPSSFSEARGYGREAEVEEIDEDFMLSGRQARMSFNGHPYPSIGPEASAFSRPRDEWMYGDNTGAPRGAMHMQEPNFHHYNDRQEPPLAFPSGNAFAFDHEPVPDPVIGYSRQQQHSVWSPPQQAWPNFQPTDFRAPLLHPRLVQLPERPITPHDTYRYPASHVEYTYVAPAIPEVSAESVNAAFAMWYAAQVINILDIPGQYRPGVGGASDELWGPGGREKDAWLRVGRSPPDYSKPWGRMGMTQTPVPKPRPVHHRRPELEARDPWNVAWSHADKPSPDFVSFILDMIQRMTISPTALVAGVWFLQGLGLHEGDGTKGAELRDFLREYRSYEPEAIERRVATLGLILAGKWLDDNSFLTKSWCEVTTIPVKQLDIMERCALHDLNFSLFVPVSSWVDHVNKLYTALISKVLPDEVDDIVIPFIDQMVTEAREVELDDPQSASSSPNYDRRLSAEELPAAADQAISRDWGSFARTYAQVPTDHAPWDTRGADIDVEMERAERSVDALVNEEEDEEEEEFLDYDGAKRWLPPVSELKRSTSNSSERSYGSDNSHQRVTSYPSYTNHVAIDEFASSSRHRSSSDWTSLGSKPTKTSDWRSADAFDYDQRIAPSCCQRCDGQKSVHKRSPLGSRGHPNIGYPIEPGISVVAPPTQLYEPISEFGYMGASSLSGTKRWGTSASQW
ncbi:hypothetical protein CI109_101931 [Kwoniella shandongensis]|uniref:Cyclin N-terminal domain-containing protein n=1 Tax=Kwoniella shandongensis TaxID=1734106 RepID=A0AAJ8LHP9_9TREE